jgi:hypothetical protein
VYSEFKLPARDSRLFQHLIERYLGEKEFEHYRDHANWNGCGDTRLGSELAAQSLQLFAEYPEKDRNALILTFANLVAAVHSFNGRANISNFPPELIWALIGITPQVYEGKGMAEAARIKPKKKRS